MDEDTLSAGLALLGLGADSLAGQVEDSPFVKGRLPIRVRVLSQDVLA